MIVLNGLQKANLQWFESGKSDILKPESVPRAKTASAHPPDKSTGSASWRLHCQNAIAYCRRPTVFSKVIIGRRRRQCINLDDRASFGAIYRAEKKSLYVVWWSLLLLLLITSAWTCLRHSRNHVQRLFLSSVVRFQVSYNMNLGQKDKISCPTFVHYLQSWEKVFVRGCKNVSGKFRQKW